MQDGQLQLTDRVSPNVSVAWRLRPSMGVAVLGMLVLAGCSSTGTRAPVTDLSNGQAAPAAQAGGTYVVRPGDTLLKIARAHNVDMDSLRRWNNLTDPNQLTVGQVLKLSASGAVATAPASGGSRVTPITGTTPQPRPLDDNTMKPDEGTPATPAAPPPVATPARTAPAPDAGVINWGWPASGNLIQTFNANSKGIDIAGSPGDPVNAAADGKVMYSGNGVRGLGNLIIINHQNGFITAYAHNRTLLVKTGQEVKRGAKIAEIGETDATSPRLHFEVRRQGTPVDPLKYLPQK
jgi:lipoprotein NlpD